MKDLTCYLKGSIQGQSRSNNAIWGHHKDIIAYLNFALPGKIKFEDPYEDFQNKGEESQWQPLHHTQLQKFEEYYTKLQPRTRDRRLLAKFILLPLRHENRRFGPNTYS